jgi:hypothetical protein
MSGVVDTSIADLAESKLDTVLKAIEALSIRTNEIESFVSRLHNDLGAGPSQTSPAPQVFPSGEPSILPIQEENPSTQHVETLRIKEPRISLPDKFDGTRSKFRGFVNQIQLITFLQPQRYPTDESRVGLVGTLLTGQALSWFAPLFEKRSPILNNFEMFLAAFGEAFGEHDKIRWATTKIRSLRQGSRSASVYASDFRQLACDINWDEEALMSQFHWGLRDDVKDLLLSLSDPQTLSEAISQAVKCDNRLFQRRQDQRSWTSSKPYRSPSHSAASTNISGSHSEVEDMQIDAVRFKPLTPQEKKRRFEEGLCLYCGEPGHKADSCSKKQHRHTFKTRSTFVGDHQQSKNEETQPQ